MRFPRAPHEHEIAEHEPGTTIAAASIFVLNASPTRAAVSSSVRSRPDSTARAPA